MSGFDGNHHPDLSTLYATGVIEDGDSAPDAEKGPRRSGEPSCAGRVVTAFILGVFVLMVLFALNAVIVLIRLLFGLA